MILYYRISVKYSVSIVVWQCKHNVRAKEQCSVIFMLSSTKTCVHTSPFCHASLTTVMSSVCAHTQRFRVHSRFIESSRALLGVHIIRLKSTKALIIRVAGRTMNKASWEKWGVAAWITVEGRFPRAENSNIDYFFQWLRINACRRWFGVSRETMRQKRTSTSVIRTASGGLLTMRLSLQSSFLLHLYAHVIVLPVVKSRRPFIGYMHSSWRDYFMLEQEQFFYKLFLRISSSTR